MRIKLTWALILAVMFVCVAMGCHTADRWAQCAAAGADRPTFDAHQTGDLL